MSRLVTVTVLVDSRSDAEALANVEDRLTKLDESGPRAHLVKAEVRKVSNDRARKLQRGEVAA